MDAAVARMQVEDLARPSAAPNQEPSAVALKPDALTPESFHAHVNRAAEWQAAAALREASTDPSTLVTAVTAAGTNTNGIGLDVHGKGAQLAEQVAEIDNQRGYSNPTTAKLMALVRHHAVAERNTEQKRIGQGTSIAPSENANLGETAAATPETEKEAAKPSIARGKLIAEDGLTTRPAVPEMDFAPADDDGMVSIDTEPSPKALSASPDGPRFDYKPSSQAALSEPSPIASTIKADEPRLQPLPSSAAMPSVAASQEIEAGTAPNANTPFRLELGDQPGLSRNGKGRYFVVPASPALAA